MIDETTYFSEEWLPGSIFLTNGEIVNNKLIRYNGLLDNLFWLEPKSKRVIMLDKGSVQWFHFLDFQDDSTIYFRKIKIKRDIISDTCEIFAQEVFAGEMSLFVAHNFIVQRKELLHKDGIPYQKAIYEEEPVYYFRYADNKTVGLRFLTRKNLYAIFPESKAQLKQFLRENRQGKIWNHSELIKLAQFLNTLIDTD